MPHSFCESSLNWTQELNKVTTQQISHDDWRGIVGYKSNFSKFCIISGEEHCTSVFIKVAILICLYKGTFELFLLNTFLASQVTTQAVLHWESCFLDSEHSNFLMEIKLSPGA